MTDDTPPQTGEILIYTSPDGQVKIDAYLQDETVWLTQKKMAALFGVEVPTINYHLKEIFQAQELGEDLVIRKIRITAADSKAYLTNFYNLDAIISVGYRVNSLQATRFRQWATQTLRGYIIKGFVLDDVRLKNGQHFGKDYFEELLEKIREIRASERRFYQKITDLYATAADYQAGDPLTKVFFQTVQNKLEWAIIGQTASEIIVARAGAAKPNMGLSNWKNSPDGKILKTDVSVAKNYLTQGELSKLNRFVSMYLDYAENQAARARPMTMADWKDKLDAFLVFNEYDLLKNAGTVQASVAKKLAEVEYEKYRVVQDRSFESDFDKVIERTTGKTGDADIHKP